jgi:hypothetical protein
MDAACFRLIAAPDGLDTLVNHLKAFILNAMRDEDSVHQLEASPVALLRRPLTCAGPRSGSPMVLELCPRRESLLRQRERRRE